MKLFLLAVLMAVGCAASIAQDFDYYQTLLPKGPIPKDFTEQSAAKVATQVTDISEKKARIKKAKKKFVLESTFGIDDFLVSGSVLFNDDVSLYLDKVLKELLKPYPDLQKKIRVYAVKSPAVNAFTTNDGLIFVNLGLLSRLENEAQLAFVLSHEIVHFQKKHVINAYVTNLDINESKGDYRKLSVSEKGFAKSSYAKELESEADLAGADIYAKSAYRKDSVDKIFDILRMADYPITWTVFDKQIFESSAYIFPDSLALNAITALDINEDYDDSQQSHPNIKKRREAMVKKFKTLTGGEEFKVSKTQFFTSKKIAQYELCRLYLLEHRFAEALALAISLQYENRKSTYLRETIAKALYGLAKQSLNDELMLSNEQWKGEPERLSHFLKEQSSYELSVLAIRELYLSKEKNPASAEIGLMVDDLIESFATVHEGAGKNFLRSKAEQPIQQLKYPYTQFAFLDFKDNATFFKIFDKLSSVKKKEPLKKTKNKKSKKKASSRINKVVVVNPMYKKIDTRKKQKLRHIETEEVLLNINDKILDAASELSLKTDIINPNKISATQVVIMQENSIMNDWIDEQMRSGDKKMISSIYNEVINLADAHKTDHFAWMGGLTIQRKLRGKGFIVLGTLMLPAVAPFSLYCLLRPQSRTLYFSLVFNVRKQELEMVDLRLMGMKDSDLLLQSNIYYTLFKLNN